MLVLDAGNALFKKDVKLESDAAARPRAELLLQQMEALGTAAMAVGTRDLLLGVDFLKKHTQDAKMKLLSANLVGPDAKPLFPASTVLTAGGVKLGVVGLSPEGAVAGQTGLVGKPPIPAAIAEARRLRKAEKVDVVVLLAAIPYQESLKLSKQVGADAELIVQTSEGRGAGTVQQHDQAYFVPAGERGRQLSRVELSINGPGPFVDLSEIDRSKQTADMLASNLKWAKERLASTQDPVIQKDLQESIANLAKRQQEAQKKASMSKAGLKRTLHYSYLHLGPEVKDDPELKKQVEQIEPPGSVAHH